MTNLLMTLVGAAVIATGGYAATSLLDDSEPARTVSLPGATTDDGTTTDDIGDISGPCDEAEHRNDPRCTGIVPIAPAPGTTTEDDRDISGPCDEAEHRNDPRCTGGTTPDEDRSGPGHGRDDDHDRDDDDDREDRSGPNSGRG